MDTGCTKRRNSISPGMGLDKKGETAVRPIAAIVIIVQTPRLPFVAAL